MSTTEVMAVEAEDGSSAPDSDHNHLKQTPTSNKPRKSHFSANKLPADIRADIESMYRSIPQIKQVFEVFDRIGSGTFSSVYLAGLKGRSDVKEQFALKHIIPTSHPSRIENELRCLQEIGGCDYVMGVKACIREKDHVVIVMPYFPHDRFQDYVESMSVEEIRDYMRALLTALRRVHQVHIIHRDVKPSNFLYNRITKQYSLVDFGLAMKVPGTDEAAGTGANNSARTTRSGQKASPQKKRKQRGQDDTENSTTTATTTSPGAPSPQKKRASTESPHLAELDVNIPPPGEEGSRRSTPGVTAGSRRPTVKSPRRVLLTKRAMQQSQDIVTTPTNTNSNSNSNKNAGLSGTRSQSAPQSATQSGTKGALSGSKAGLSGTRTPGSKTPYSGSRLTQPGSKTTPGSQSLVRSNSASGKAVYKSGSAVTCGCYGKPQVCSVCTSRSSQHAPRAGTQGFRSPEVLLKYPQQTTAVDMWSAGVILLSMLSGRYPFFKAQDDLNALAQLISVFGTNTMQTAALTFGKNLLSSPIMPSLNLRAMCLKLRGMSSRRKASPMGNTDLPDEAFDLLRGLLDPCPHTRLTAEQALQHSFLMLG